MLEAVLVSPEPDKPETEDKAKELENKMKESQEKIKSIKEKLSFSKYPAGNDATRAISATVSTWAASTGPASS